MPTPFKPSLPAGLLALLLSFPSQGLAQTTEVATNAPPLVSTPAPPAAARPASVNRTSAALPRDETFTTVAAAQASCPADTVVWSTFSRSKSFHLAASRYFGKTKHGAFVCEKVALAAGFHAAKS